ncbi:protein of unknown function (DUF1778), partial [Pseudoalteromonas luteoviolacea 2ta16]
MEVKHVDENERISARVPAHVHQMLRQAADLTGATVNQFLASPPWNGPI